MNVQQTFYTSYGATVAGPTHDKSGSEALRREAAQREMAYVHALSSAPAQRPRSSVPEIRQADLPDEFSSCAAELHKAIAGRGVAVDRAGLVALGTQRFAELLVADREARNEQRVFGPRTDLSSWDSVKFSFGNIGAGQASIPERTSTERLTGKRLDSDAVRQLDGFQDLWKIFYAQPRAVRAVYAFRDKFEPLVFARSLLQLLEAGDDDRLRSNFLVGGNLRKVRLFETWIPILRRPLFSVRIRDPLFGLVAWLARETNPAPEPGDLAREFLDVRAPDAETLRFCEALGQGFVLGLDGWSLWQHVGRLTRKHHDHDQLARWRLKLAKGFPRIEAFHKTLRAAFTREMGYGINNHLELDDKRHQLFLDEILYDRLQQMCFVVALAIDQTLPDCLIACFQNWFLAETAKPPKALAENINKALQTAFPGSTFELQLESV